MACYNRRLKKGLLWLTVLLGVMHSAHAVAADGGISVGQTRVIFSDKQNSAKVTLKNHSDRVYLINSRVLRTPDGRDDATQASTVPFLITPPLFRLESGARNAVLVVRNNTTALPADRESVFYLSFLAIPAVSQPADEGLDGGMQPRVSVGIRTVIKLFYRPSALGLAVDAAPEKLVFTRNGALLHVDNPTPYYQTLANLTVGGQAVDIRAQGAMIAPFSQGDYRTTGAGKAVSWAVIDDYGGLSRTYQSALHGEP